MLSVIKFFSILASSGFLAVRVSPTTNCSDSFYVKNESGWIQDCELAEKRHLQFQANVSDSLVAIVFSVDSQFMELNGRKENYSLSKRKVCLDSKKHDKPVPCFVIKKRFGPRK